MKQQIMDIKKFLLQWLLFCKVLPTINSPIQTTL